VPIEFRERERGDSKMGGHVVAEALKRTTELGAAHRVRQASEALGRVADRLAAR